MSHYAPSKAPSRLPPLWLIALLPGLGVFASSIYLPSLPAMAADLRVPVAWVQFSMTIYLLAMTCCMLVVGPLSDRFGRRYLTLGTLSLFLVGSALAVVAGHITVLLVARGFQGVGASGGIVLARSMLRDRFSDQASARTSAHMSISIAVAPIVAPLVGGALQSLFGWRANMLLIALLAAALLGITAQWLHETHPPHKRHTANTGAMVQRYLCLLGTRNFMAYTLPIALAAAATFAYQTEAPVLLIGQLHLNAATYGVYAALPAVGFIVGGSMTIRLASRIPGDTLIRAGCTLFVVSGLLMMFCALCFRLHPLTLIGPMTLFAIGNGLVLPNASVGSMNVMPLVIGASAALSSCLRMGGGAMGSMLAAALPGHSGAWLGGVLTTMGLSALACRHLLHHDTASIDFAEETSQ